MILLNREDISQYVTNFPDLTRQLWKISPTLLNSQGQNFIEWLYESDAELMILHQLTLLLKQYNPPSYIYLSIPYLPYGRQDKDIDNSSTFALHSLAAILNTLPVHSISTRDVHSDIATSLIHRLSSLPISDYERLSKNYDYVVFPDKGAAARYSTHFSAIPHIICEKVREQSTGKITGIKLQEKIKLTQPVRLLVVDDICDGGATFTALADHLYSTRVYNGKIDKLDLIVTHGIFSKGFSKLFTFFDQIYTTNSLVQYYEYQNKERRRVNCAQSPWFKEMYKYLDLNRLCILEVR